MESDCKTPPSRIQHIINELQSDLYLLANDIINSAISPFIRISELLTLLMKHVELYRNLNGTEKRQIVLQLGLIFISRYSSEEDRDTLEGIFNEDARDLIELIVSTSHIVNRRIRLLRLFHCLCP
jgi:hypothetical protein